MFTKLNKKTNKHFIDNTKTPLFLAGTKIYGSPITKLAMYEAMGEPTKLAKLLQNATTLVEGAGFTQKQAEVASAECERVKNETAAGVLDAIVRDLNENGYASAAAYLRAQFGYEEDCQTEETEAVEGDKTGKGKMPD